MDTEQVLLHARLIDHLCRLIAETENIVSFHGMVERIAELAKYPAKFIETVTTLDIQLDRLKILAGWPNLKKAVELHGQVSESRTNFSALILKHKDIPPELHHEIGKCLASHSSSQVHDLFFKLLLIDHPVIPADFRAAQLLLNDPTIKAAFEMRGRVWN